MIKSRHLSEPTETAEDNLRCLLASSSGKRGGAFQVSVAFSM